MAIKAKNLKSFYTYCIPSDIPTVKRTSVRREGIEGGMRDSQESVRTLQDKAADGNQTRHL